MNKANKEDHLLHVHFSYWDILKVIIFISAYYVAFRIAYLFPDAEKILVAIWPAGGIGLAALLLSPRRLWPLILGAFFVVGNISNLMIGRPLFNSLGFMTANILESYGCAWIIMKWCGENIRFKTMKEILALIFAATVVNAGTAFIGGGTAWIAGISPFWNFWKFWWIADGLGILIVTPLIIAWSRFKDISFKNQWKKWLEFIIFMILWYRISQLSFMVHSPINPFTMRPYFLVAVLAYAAIRLGQEGITVLLAVLSFISIPSEAMTTGPSPLGGETMNDRLLLLQVFISSIAVMGYIVAASYFESRSAERISREEQSRIRALGDNIPNGVVFQVLRELDGNLRIQYLSAGIRKLTGVSAEEALIDPSMIFDLVIEEDRHETFGLVDASARQMSMINIATRMRRLDGEIRWMQLSSSPRRLEDGRILWDGIMMDITERKKAEDEARLNSEIFKNISEGVCLIGMNDGFIKHVNAKFEQMFGYDHGEMIGKDISIVNAVTDKTPQEKREEIMIALKDNEEWHGEVKNIRKDGTLFWCYANVSLFDHPQYGRVIVAVHTDITQRKLDDESIRASLEEKTVLLNEVHHRVKNNLQIISSLLNLQAMRTRNKEALETLLETGNRVYSMAMLHETLYGSGNLARVNFPGYIEKICAHVLRSYGSKTANIRMEYRLADINLEMDQAVPCGLIINELVSNSFKHAFPDERKGSIIVELKTFQGDEIKLTVGDDGIGLPDGLDINQSETLGLKLVSMLVEKLKGNVEIIRNEGTVFNITFRIGNPERLL